MNFKTFTGALVLLLLLLSANTARREKLTKELVVDFLRLGLSQFAMITSVYYFRWRPKLYTLRFLAAPALFERPAIFLPFSQTICFSYSDSRTLDNH